MLIRMFILRVPLLPFLFCVHSVAGYAAENNAGSGIKLDVENSLSPFAILNDVPIRAVTLGEGIWSTRFRTNAKTSIPAFYESLEKAGVLDKLRGRSNKARGNSDADLAKWIEAASYVLQSQENETIGNLLHEVVNDISASAGNGGYLHTRYMIKMPPALDKLRPGGYLYCLGHLLQAAIAYHQATGDNRLLDVFVPYIDNVVEQFGSGKKPCWSGHPEIEIALVELYKTTGNKKYLDFARYLLEEVDLTDNAKTSDINFDHYFSGAPFSSRKTISGHAVCALYRCCGATGLYLETGEDKIYRNLLTLWHDLTEGKMYVTGGVGSRPADEAIGDSYELPNERGYAETCAAIANIMWNRQMLNATGKACFTDVIERTLYSGFLSGVSIDGRTYFYWNPLASRSNASKLRKFSEDDNLIAAKKSTGIGLDVRLPYYQTPCCIPNAQRMIASLPGYIYGTNSQGVWIHLYHSSRLDWHFQDGTKLSLSQSTKYPWQNTVNIVFDEVPSGKFSLFVRIPHWTTKATVAVNEQSPCIVNNPGSYHQIRRRWQANDRVEITFDMPIRAVHANPQVRQNRGRVALQRGPIVYCLESVDHQDTSVFDIVLPFDLSDIDDALEARFEPDLLGGVVTLRGAALAYDSSSEKKLYSFAPFSGNLKPIKITAIPYFAWANRGPSEMTVWIPQAPKNR
jgi:DUF1680 family protein